MNAEGIPFPAQGKAAGAVAGLCAAGRAFAAL
jgi:hypothetical protein